MNWLTRLFAKPTPVVADDKPVLNRAARRELANMKPGEQRMRRERTLLMQAKRRSGERGDHGAKARRAYQDGVRWGLGFTKQQALKAYAIGVQEGRHQRPFWERLISI